MRRIDGVSMNQLEFDNVRLLANIRHFILRCIANQLDDELRSSTSLNLEVFNLRSLFMCGVAAIPVHLPSENSITPENSKDFIERLNRLLELFESLVHRDVLCEDRLCVSECRTGQCMSQKVQMDTENTQWPPSKTAQVPTIESSAQLKASSTSMTSAYPKLLALSKRISQDRKSGLAHSKFLRLPSTAEEAGEAASIVTDFNDSNHLQTTLDDPKPNRTPSESRIKPLSAESKSTISSRKCLMGLWKALASNPNCTSTHLAKIQIRHPGEVTCKTDETEHNIFLSCSVNQDKWQQTTCGMISKIPKSRSLKVVPNICTVIGRSIETEKTLKIMIHDNGIVCDYSAAKRIKKPQVLPTLSLDNILRDGSRSLSPHHKITLALNLSHSLSQLYSGDMSTEWTSQDVLFLFNQDACAIKQAYNPYVPYSLCQKTQDGDSELASTRKFALLVAFGKLLVEIALGRILEDSELDLYPRADVALLTIIDDVEEGIEENVPPEYLEAIEACLEANKDDDYDEESDDGGDMETDEESQIRGILDYVVERLESCRVYFRSEKRQQKPELNNPNFPKRLNVSQSLLRQIASPRCIKTQNLHYSIPPLVNEIANDRFAESRSQLFDGRRYTSQTEDEKAVLARDFMCRVSRFREAYIEDLPTESRVRIAILDTGVDESNAFVLGVCKTMKRRKGHSPFKEIKSFIEGGTGVDKVGHGTNVAALVLAVAPEADLYIAQIAQNTAEANTQQIVKAIDWARDRDVHIISMSFGMSEDCSEIEKAIGRAEVDNIIIFAAASNYGGNQRRAFPARMDKVICINSSDGNGVPSGFNPSPKTPGESFTTLGEGIKSVLQDEVYLRGTSYATPIAAGLAASMLQYIQNSSLLAGRCCEKAFTRPGMISLLAAMSNEKGGFHYVTPWRRIWAVQEGDGVDSIPYKIREALKGDR